MNESPWKTRERLYIPFTISVSSARLVSLYLTCTLHVDIVMLAKWKKTWPTPRFCNVTCILLYRTLFYLYDFTNLSSIWTLCSFQDQRKLHAAGGRRRLEQRKQNWILQSAEVAEQYHRYGVTVLLTITVLIFFFLLFIVGVPYKIRVNETRQPLGINDNCRRSKLYL